RDAGLAQGFVGPDRTVARSVGLGGVRSDLFRRETSHIVAEKIQFGVVHSSSSRRGRDLPKLNVKFDEKDSQSFEVCWRFRKTMMPLDPSGLCRDLRSAMRGRHLS